MTLQALKEFETYIKQHYSDVLRISPGNSTTPFEVENMLTGKSEFLFISKCDPYVYEPLKNRDIQEKVNITLTMYVEGNNLIIRFELLDIILETEINGGQAKGFLSTLIHQEIITLVVVDAKTHNVIWLTNTIPFQTIRFHYKEIFEKYGVFE